MMVVMCLTNFVPRHYFRYTGKKIILLVEIVLQSFDISSNNRSNICHTNTGYSMLFDG